MVDPTSDMSLSQLVRAVSTNIARNAKTYQNSNHDPSVLQSMLEAEQHLAKANVEFSKLMNAFRIINRLPPEVLALIFSFVGYGSPIIPVSHVCRWWRHVALQTPCLWTLYHTNDSEDYLPLFLQRSGAALFDVRSIMIPGEQPPYRSLRFIPLVCSNMERLRSISVVYAAAGPNIADYISEILKHSNEPALALTRLSIKSFGRLDGRVFSPVFGGRMPALKHLCLCSISMWPECIVPNLQTLILTHSATPLDTFLSTLEVLQNLESMAMTEVELTHDGLLPPKRTIAAPHLRVLRLDILPNTLLDYAHLLACLAPAQPLSTYFVVHVRQAPLRALSAARPEPLNLFTAFTKLKLDVSDRYTTVTATDASATSFVSFHLSAASVHTALTPAGILLHPAVLLPMAHVTSLAVADQLDINLRGGQTVWPVSLWGALLGGMPALRTLAFDCMCIIVRPAMLALSADAACAPALARLTIASVYCVPGTAGVAGLLDFARRRPMAHMLFRSAELAGKAREAVSGYVREVDTLPEGEGPEEALIPVPRCFWDEPGKHEFLI